MKELPKIVYTIIDEEAKKLSLTIEEVIWEYTHNQYFLRIIADTEAGLTIDECTDLNQALSNRFDEVDPIPEEYMLEVSSPGIERPLKKKEDFIRFMGSYVYCKTYQAIDGKKEFYGTLTSYSEEGITLQVSDKNKQKQMEITHQQISQIRLAVKF
jgi:ribosome maturation factor RimP